MFPPKKAVSPAVSATDGRDDFRPISFVMTLKNASFAIWF
jgi:hypothetical protein